MWGTRRPGPRIVLNANVQMASEYQSCHSFCVSAKPVCRGGFLQNLKHAPTKWVAFHMLKHAQQLNHLNRPQPQLLVPVEGSGFWRATRSLTSWEIDTPSFADLLWHSATQRIPPPSPWREKLRRHCALCNVGNDTTPSRSIKYLTMI